MEDSYKVRLLIFENWADISQAVFALHYQIASISVYGTQRRSPLSSLHLPLLAVYESMLQSEEVAHSSVLDILWLSWNERAPSPHS